MQKDYKSTFKSDGGTAQRDADLSYQRCVKGRRQAGDREENLGWNGKAEFENSGEVCQQKRQEGASVSRPDPPHSSAPAPPSARPSRSATAPPPVPSVSISSRQYSKQDSPNSLKSMQTESSKIRSLFSEVIAELEERIQVCDVLERFPLLEEYIRRHSRCKSKTICALCNEEVDGSTRWHFESEHYDEFLDWLDRKERRDFRMRRAILVRHRKMMKERKTLKN